MRTNFYSNAINENSSEKLKIFLAKNQLLRVCVCIFCKEFVTKNYRLLSNHFEIARNWLTEQHHHPV